MYIPSHFAATGSQEIHDLITSHPLGTLVTRDEHGLDANHIPFLLDAQRGSRGVLLAHVARANPVWRRVRDGDQVLVVFRAEDAYISPNWYPSKHEFHKQVPTWNYRAVHVHGRITVYDSERHVRGVVARLTRIHEASQAIPWKMTDSPADYIDSMLKLIVGIEVEIDHIEAKFKLSQNKEARDLQGAGEMLKAQGDIALGQAMIACMPEQPGDS